MRVGRDHRGDGVATTLRTKSYGSASGITPPVTWRVTWIDRRGGQAVARLVAEQQSAELLRTVGGDLIEQRDRGVGAVLAMLTLDALDFVAQVLEVGQRRLRPGGLQRFRVDRLDEHIRQPAELLAVGRLLEDLLFDGRHAGPGLDPRKNASGDRSCVTAPLRGQEIWGA